MIDANTYYINKHLDEQAQEEEFEAFKSDLVEDLMNGKSVSGFLGEELYYSIDYDEVVTNMVENTCVCDLGPVLRNLALSKEMGKYSNELYTLIALAAEDLVNKEFE